MAIFFYLGNYQGNWSFWADQELILGYNGLLLNSGFPQEYMDHPGFISIQILALLLQIFHILGVGEIVTIEDFNQSPTIFSAMQYVVMVARHQTLIFGICICCVSFFLAKYVTKRNDISLLFSILIFVSNGIFYHFTITRTESFAYLFFVLSVFSFSHAFQRKQRVHNLWLFLSFALLFFGALNKSQVLLFVPLYFIWAYYFICQSEKEKSNNVSNQNNYLLIACVIATLLINLTLYWIQSHGFSLLFNMSLVLFFNVYGYLLAYKKSYPPAQTIASINVAFFAGYILLNSASQWLNYGHNLFSNIDNPISMMRFIMPDAHPVGLLDKIAPSGKWHEKVVQLLLFFTKPFLDLFKKITASTLFLIFAIGYLWTFRKTVSSSVKWFGLFCFGSYYIVALINSVRYENAFHYVLFHEFFLLSYSVLLIYLLPKSTSKIKVLSALIFLVIFVNLVPYTNYLNWLKRKGHHPFCPSGLVDYHKRMDIEKIRQECLTSKTEN